MVIFNICNKRCCKLLILFILCKIRIKLIVTCMKSERLLLFFIIVICIWEFYIVRNILKLKIITPIK